MNRCLAAAMAGAALIAGAAAASGPEPDFWHRDTLTGDWGGLRSQLSERGVDLHASYVGGFWANLGGGYETGIRYYGFANWGGALDLERLAGWTGSHFHIDWQSYHGGEPSAALVGTFPANTLGNYEAERSVRFYHLYVEQELFAGRLQIELGQIAADDDFFQSVYASDFENAAFGNFSREADEQFAPFYPLAAPGIFLELRPWRPLTLRAGAYVADVGDDDPENRGFEWSFAHGASFYTEAVWAWSPADLPGTIALGAFGTTADTFDYRRDARSDGTWAVYAVIDQALWLDADGEARLGAFLRAGFSPQPERASTRWYLQGGFQLAGPLPGRPRDALLVGGAHSAYGDDYLAHLAGTGEMAAGRGTLLEVTYRAQLTPWLQLRPSLQYFFKPHLSRRNALVFGVNAVFSL